MFIYLYSLKDFLKYIYPTQILNLHGVHNDFLKKTGLILNIMGITNMKVFMFICV